MMVKQQDSSWVECATQKEIIKAPFNRPYSCKKGTKIIGTRNTYYIIGNVVKISKLQGETSRLILTEVEVQGFLPTTSVVP